MMFSCQDEHEQREHKRKEAHTFAAGRTADCIGNELIGHFGRRLDAARHKTALGCAANKECGDHRHGGNHVGCGIGECDLGIANLCDRKQIDDLELMDGIDCHGR